MSFFQKDVDWWAKLASAVQSIAVALAVFVGGAWTLYSFNAAKTAEKALVDLELAKARKPVLDIQIESEFFVGADPSSSSPKPELHRFIKTFVALRNAGNTSAEIDLSDDTLFVSEVNVVDGKVIHDEGWNWSRHLNSALGIRKLTLPAGNSAKLAYLSRIRRPGLYFVEFRVPLSPERGAPPGPVVSPATGRERGFIVATTFVNVSDTSRGHSPNRRFQGTLAPAPEPHR
jgi:hypothetical protein